MGKLSGLPNSRKLEREKTQGAGMGEGTQGRGREGEPGEAEAWDSGASRAEGRCKSPHSEMTGRASEEPQGAPYRSQLFAPVSSRPLWHRCLQTSGNGRGMWTPRGDGAGARPRLAQGGAETERRAGTDAGGPRLTSLLREVCRFPREGPLFLRA